MDCRHAVASEYLPLTLEPDLNVIPVNTKVPKSVVQHRIRCIDPSQCRVRKDDSEAKDVSGLIAFEEHDLRLGNRLLEQRGKEQAARAATDTCHANRH